MRDIKFEATNIEIRLRGLFKRTECTKQLLTFGGIFTKENILDEGGFYIAVISTLTQYYKYENSDGIDIFIEELDDIKNSKLEDISKNTIKSILDKLISLIKE